MELLADGERTAGVVSGVIRAEFGISQPAVSQHLRVLPESGFATVPRSAPGACTPSTRAPLQEVDMWLERFRRFWSQRLDALGTELARGKRERQEQRENTAGTPSAGRQPSTTSEEDK